MTVWGKLIIEEFGIDEEDVTREIDYASRALQAIRGSIPKEADKPKVGIRVIAGGTQISTTAVSQTLSRALKLIIGECNDIVTEMFLRLGYVRSCPIVQSTDEIIKHLRYINRLCSHGHFPLDKGKVVSFDFTKLCPLLPSDAVVTNVSTIVALGFHRHRENRARRSDSTSSIFIKQECYPSKERAEWVDESRQIQKNLKASYSLMQIQLLSMRIRLPQTASSDKR